MTPGETTPPGVGSVCGTEHPTGRALASAPPPFVWGIGERTASRFSLLRRAKRGAVHFSMFDSCDGNNLCTATGGRDGARKATKARLADHPPGWFLRNLRSTERS
jgi:hypothetical protein